jgi:putative membrane protein
MSLVLRIIITAFGLWAAAELIDGIRFDPDRSIIYLAVVALIVGVLNATVRPLLTILSFPLVLVTLGLFQFVINAIVLSLALAISARFDLGLTSDGFAATLLATIVVSVVGLLANAFVGRRR